MEMGRTCNDNDHVSSSISSRKALAYAVMPYCSIISGYRSFLSVRRVLSYRVDGDSDEGQQVKNRFEGYRR